MPRGHTWRPSSISCSQSAHSFPSLLCWGGGGGKFSQTLLLMKPAAALQTTTGDAPRSPSMAPSRSHPSEDTRTQRACSHLREANLPAQSHAPVLQIHSAMEMYSRRHRLGFRAVHEVDSSSPVPSLVRRTPSSAFSMVN